MPRDVLSEAKARTISLLVGAAVRMKQGVPAHALMCSYSQGETLYTKARLATSSTGVPLFLTI